MTSNPIIIDCNIYNNVAWELHFLGEFVKGLCLKKICRYSDCHFPLQTVSDILNPRTRSAIIAEPNA